MPPLPFKPLRVLLVDDFAPFADQLADVLRRKGHIVRVAYQGDEGLRVADEFQPHALISDIHMPGMNGFELAQAFADRHPRCGVVLVTMDTALMGWDHKNGVYKILHKAGGVQAILDFLATCKAGE